MKTLVNVDGKTVRVADADVDKSIKLLKDAGHEFRVLEQVHDGGSTAVAPAPPKLGKQAK